MTYAEARQVLTGRVNVEALAVNHGRLAQPDLHRMQRIMEVLDQPQRSYPVVHLTGTNGKTSTARVLSSLVEHMGLVAGTYTSPDLGQVNERMQRNCDPIDDVSFAEALGAVVAVESLIEPDRLSWFELVTATALLWFADAPVDMAVVEVGMLGRWDATNVVDGQVAVVTNIGLDHAAYAGPTRADVAREKAGIVKPGSVLVLGETDPELASIFDDLGQAETWRRGPDWGWTDNRVAYGGRLLDLFTPNASYTEMFVPMHGAHMGDNVAAALAAAEAFFGEPLPEDVVEEGLAGATSPGRLEVVGHQPLVVLDGAHNVEGMRALLAALREGFDVTGRMHVVFGALIGHDPADLLAELDRDSVASFTACAADWPRAISASDIASAAERLGLPVATVPSVAKGVASAVAGAGPDDLVLVTGSLYVVGEARQTLT
ncbi:MAG: bifunctional folylpolyglutamate synthase/dihydrofolate synthase [Acidimicrobiales bacterium]